jgi:hypothetical protein
MTRSLRLGLLIAALACGASLIPAVASASPGSYSSPSYYSPSYYSPSYYSPSYYTPSATTRRATTRRATTVNSMALATPRTSMSRRISARTERTSRVTGATARAMGFERARSFVAHSPEAWLAQRSLAGNDRCDCCAGRSGSVQRRTELCGFAVQPSDGLTVTTRNPTSRSPSHNANERVGATARTRAGVAIAQGGAQWYAATVRGILVRSI